MDALPPVAEVEPPVDALPPVAEVEPPEAIGPAPPVAEAEPPVAEVEPPEAIGPAPPVAEAEPAEAVGPAPPVAVVPPNMPVVVPMPPVALELLLPLLTPKVPAEAHAWPQTGVASPLPRLGEHPKARSEPMLKSQTVECVDGEVFMYAGGTGSIAQVVPKANRWRGSARSSPTPA